MINRLIIANFGLKFLSLLALTTFWGGLIYRVLGLGLLGTVLSLILSIVSFIILLKIERKYNLHSIPEILDSSLRGNGKWGDISSLMLVLSYLASSAYAFYVLYQAATVKSIVSPWEVVPGYFFGVYFLATAILFILLSRGRRKNLLLVSLHFFLTYSVILFVYRLGYGYDYFIHQATLELIDKQGVVEPQPFYYLGQYGLLTILHKISGLSLAWLHRLLVPFMAALFLPAVLYRLLVDWLKINLRPHYLLLFLLLPLPLLTFTTPQNFALLLLVFIILLGVCLRNYYDLALIGILTFATLLIHPLAGVPALLIFLALIAREASVSAWFRRLAYASIFFLCAILLPLAFYFFERPQISASSWSFAGLLPKFSFAAAGTDNIILNFAYFYNYNFWLVFAVLSLAGLILARKYEQRKQLAPYLLVSGGLFVAYGLTKILPFNFLIGYERDDYSQRILLAACLFLAPFIILSIIRLAELIREQNNYFRFAWFVFTLLLMTASLYLAYPRFDRYYNSRGYSVGASDMAAVDWLDKNSKGDYIVLANQQVSAAALSRFGFKKYYPGDIFYYPIPTGGPLYNYYLEMVYQKPTRETMAKAMELAGVSRGYFVLNKYWTDFAKVLAEAKLSADSWKEFDHGQVYVFSY